jgi:hypothetical protein
MINAPRPGNICFPFFVFPPETMHIFLELYEALKRERWSRRAEAGTSKAEGDEDADGPEEMDKMD